MLHLPAYGTRRVGVITQIDRSENLFQEIPGIVERPECCLQALDHIAAAGDLGWLSLAERASRDGFYLWIQRSGG